MDHNRLEPAEIPDGAEIFLLFHPHDGEPTLLVGRVAHEGLPCVSGNGCLQPDSITVYRYPAGHNSPTEEHTTGVVLWCEHDGAVAVFFDRPDSDERVWGWDRPVMAP